MNELRIIRVENGFIVLEENPSRAEWGLRKWVAADPVALATLIKLLVTSPPEGARIAQKGVSVQTNEVTRESK